MRVAKLEDVYVECANCKKEFMVPGSIYKKRMATSISKQLYCGIKCNGVARVRPIPASRAALENAVRVMTWIRDLDSSALGDFSIMIQLQCRDALVQIENAK